MEIKKFMTTIRDFVQIEKFKQNVKLCDIASELHISPQCLSMKLKRNSFTIEELHLIANKLGCKFVQRFEFADGSFIEV